MAEPGRTPQAGAAADALARADLRDLEEALAERRAAAKRHTLWALVGLSPAAAFPLALWAGGGAVGAVVLLVVAVTGMEAWRAVQARADVTELEARLSAARRAAEPPAE